jgi:hypothetical protein
MKFLTKDNLTRLHKNAAETEAAQGADLGHWPVVKLFSPWGSATWLLTELDADGVAFGLCDLGMGEPELGYVDLQELTEVRGPFGLRIERDLHFKATKSLTDYADEARLMGSIAA